jgi:hypothetical protein
LHGLSAADDGLFGTAVAIVHVVVVAVLVVLALASETLELLPLSIVECASEAIVHRAPEVPVDVEVQVVLIQVQAALQDAHRSEGVSVIALIVHLSIHNHSIHQIVFFILIVVFISIVFPLLSLNVLKLLSHACLHLVVFVVLILQYSPIQVRPLVFLPVLIASLVVQYDLVLLSLGQSGQVLCLIPQRVSHLLVQLELLVINLLGQFLEGVVLRRSQHDVELVRLALWLVARVGGGGLLALVEALLLVLSVVDLELALHVVHQDERAGRLPLAVSLLSEVLHVRHYLDGVLLL